MGNVRIPDRMDQVAGAAGEVNEGMMNILKELEGIVGASGIVAGAAVEERYRTDLMRQVHPAPLCLVRPKSNEEVAAVLRLANAHGTPVTTQGGMTGTVLGAIAGEDAIILSLERMNRIEEIDQASMTMTVEAGALLQTVQEQAEAAGLFVPLDIGSRGTATMGGVIATNAGGLRAVRWGVARDMVLGLEAVLADGTVVTGLKKVLKDNAGYDWKHLLIGSEGTLGVVTRASLRLRARPLSTMTAIAALDSFDAVLALLRRLDCELGGQLTSYEVMWRNFYEVVTEGNRDKRSPPLPPGHAYYIVVEAMGGDPERDMDQFEAVLARAISQGEVADVVIAQSESQRENLWAVREDLEAPMRKHMLAFAFDISVPLSVMSNVVRDVEEAIRRDYPDAMILTYGHLGDSNVHFVVGVGDFSKAAEHKVDIAVYSAVSRAGGSISAEHGVGLAKRDYLHFSRTEGELALMRTIKAALDPKNILNPGKLIDMAKKGAPA